MIWAQGLNKQDNAKIQKIQRLALLAILRPLRSTPTAGMETIMGWMPLKMHCTKIGLCAYLRIKTLITQRWDGIGKMSKVMGHIHKWAKLEDNILSSNIPRQPKISEKIWIDHRSNGCSHSSETF